MGRGRREIFKQTQVSNNQRLISDVIIERLANVLVLGSKLI